MKTLHKVAIGTAVLAVALAGIAIADSDHGGMHGPGMGMMHGAQGGAMQHGMAIEDRVASLKSELGITPTQETAWAQYAKTLQDTAAAAKTTHEGVDPNAVSKMSPSDRYAFVTKMREQSQKQFEPVKTAAEALLGVLDDGQKAKARDILPGLIAFGPGAMHEANVGGPRHQR